MIVWVIETQLFNCNNHFTIVFYLIDAVKGAMVNEEKICRVLDYFFEMEIIDDNGDLFTVANCYAQDDQLLLYLETIVQYLS